MYNPLTEVVYTKQTHASSILKVPHPANYCVNLTFHLPVGGNHLQQGQHTTDGTTVIQVCSGDKLTCNGNDIANFVLRSVIRFLLAKHISPWKSTAN